MGEREPSGRKTVQDFLDEGFIDGSQKNGIELEALMLDKKVTAIYIDQNGSFSTYENLQLIAYRSIGGYGLQVRGGGLLKISDMTNRNPNSMNNQPINNWLFKIE